VDNGSEKGLKIRFIGIDAPESRRMFKREVGYYGKEAKLYLTELLTNKKVRLVSDVDSLDQYGRTLSYVYLEDGTFINAELIKNGFAVLMTVPPNVKFSDYFAKLQSQARDNNKGLWNIELKNSMKTID
jgi:micrococcal nuclease